MHAPMTLAPTRSVKSNTRAWKAPCPNVSSGSQLIALTMCTAGSCHPDRCACVHTGPGRAVASARDDVRRRRRCRTRALVADRRDEQLDPVAGVRVADAVRAAAGVVDRDAARAVGLAAIPAEVEVHVERGRPDARVPAQLLIH